jgi:hypothetical protein
MINLMEQLDHAAAYLGKRINWRIVMWLLAVPVGFFVVLLLFIKSDLFGSLLGTLLALALMIFVVLLYFLPAIIAYRQKKLNKEAILALNVFLGWTVLGWVVALVWAYTKNDANSAVARSSVLCASCGKYSDGRSSFCAHCGRGLSLA